MNRNDPIRVFATLVFLNALLACSGAPEWTGSVEIRDGVKVVLNPHRPLLSDAQGLVTELWAVQGSDWMDPTSTQAQLKTTTSPAAARRRFDGRTQTLLSVAWSFRASHKITWRQNRLWAVPNPCVCQRHVESPAKANTRPRS